MSREEISGAISHARSIGLRDDRIELIYSDAAINAITVNAGTAFQGFTLALALLGFPLPPRLGPNNKRRAAMIKKIAAAPTERNFHV
jgi:hypothetical protein